MTSTMMLLLNISLKTLILTRHIKFRIKPVHMLLPTLRVHMWNIFLAHLTR